MAANSESILYAVNDAGHAVGLKGFNNTPTERAILVTGNTVHDLAPLVGAGSLATGINNAGRVCGSGGSSPKAFVYDSASNTVLAHIDPVAGGAKTYAVAINGLGQVVGTCDNNHGFFYDGTVKDLGLAGFVEDVNEAGKICGSVGKPWPQAFSPGTWDGTAASPTFTEIPVPPGFLGGHASGINNTGDIVGTCWTPQTYDINPSAYIHSLGVSTDLNSLIPANSGWHLEFAEAINDKGQIAGMGQLNGNETAFLLTPQNSSPFAHITLPELVAILILGGVIYGGSGLVVLPGGPPIPVGPFRVWETLPADKRDALVGLALDQLAQRIENREARQAIRTAALTAVRGSVDRLIETANLPAPAQAMIARRRTALGSGKLATSLARFGHRS